MCIRDRIWLVELLQAAAISGSIYTLQCWTKTVESSFSISECFFCLLLLFFSLLIAQWESEPLFDMFPCMKLVARAIPREFLRVSLSNALCRLHVCLQANLGWITCTCIFKKKHLCLMPMISLMRTRWGRISHGSRSHLLGIKRLCSTDHLFSESL